MRLLVPALLLTACTQVPDDPGLRFAPLAEDEHAILFMGDILLSERSEEVYAERGYAWAFSGIQAAMDSADAVAIVGNHEGPITERTEKHPPNTDWNYGADPASALAFAPAGFTHLSLANNHALDRGAPGLTDTRARLEAAGIVPFGGGSTRQQAHEPAVVEAGGTSVALVGAMQAWGHYAAAGWQAEDEGGVLLMEQGPFDDALAEVDADLVVLVAHWGSTYAPITDRQRDDAAYSVERGVDAIVGHHSHGAQSFSEVDGAPVVWSVGNAAFGTRGRFGEDEDGGPREGYGLLARLVIADGSVDRWELMPIRVNNYLVDYRAVPPEEDTAEEVLLELAEREGTDVEIDGGVAVFRAGR